MSGPRKIRDYMMSDPSLAQNQVEGGSSTAGSAPEIKEQTSHLRSDISKKGSQSTKLSKTSAAGSTSREKDLSPYWNQSSAALSKKLLSRIKTGSVDLDLNSSVPLQTSTLVGSWFSTTVLSPLPKNLCRTSFPSSTCFPADFTVSENTVVRSKKIRIYPKLKALQRLRNYLGLSRYWYNQTVEHLRKPGTKASLFEVRKIQKNEHPEWAFNCPQRIREHSISDACDAVKNAKVKGKTAGQFQEVKFRRRRSMTQGFGLDKISLRSDFLFSGKNFRIYFHPSESAQEPELEGVRVVVEDGRWFLILPQKRPIKVPENQRNGTVALDPGVRTFQSFYSPKVFGKIGEGDFQEIYRLCVGLDNLQSQIDRAGCRQKRRLRKAAGRLRWKIFDRVDDLHKKTAYFLVTRFDRILIPTFETSQMVSKLRSKTARSMLTFAHYRFKQFLKIKAEEYSCEVLEVSEAYTSKTCSYCGKVQNIGSKSRMKCSCGIDVDRDLNASRGIYLRTLAATPSQRSPGCIC